MSQISQIGTWTVFLAGILSFFSPCTLPLLPLYFSILAGGDIRAQDKKVTLITNSLGFISGFSLIFILLGLSATALGRFLLVNRLLLSKIASVFVVFFGIFLVGGFQIPLLMREKRLHFHFHKITPLSAFIMGCSFSLGWTPCLSRPCLGAPHRREHPACGFGRLSAFGLFCRFRASFFTAGTGCRKNYEYNAQNSPRYASFPESSGRHPDIDGGNFVFRITLAEV